MSNFPEETALYEVDDELKSAIDEFLSTLKRPPYSHARRNPWWIWDTNDAMASAISPQDVARALHEDYGAPERLVDLANKLDAAKAQYNSAIYALYASAALKLTEAERSVLIPR